MKAPRCTQHDDRCVAVMMEATSTVDGVVAWDERRYVSVEHLDQAAAEQVAEWEAQRLSAHWGHVQWKRSSRNRWRVWEPAPEKIECSVLIVEHPDRWEQ